MKGGRGWKEREASLYEGRLDDQSGVKINSELPDFLKNPTRLSDKVENQESADVKENELSEDERAKGFGKARELRMRNLDSFTANSYYEDSDYRRQRLQRLGDDPHFDSRQFHLQKNGEKQLNSAQTEEQYF